MMMSLIKFYDDSVENVDYLFVEGASELWARVQYNTQVYNITSFYNKKKERKKQQQREWDVYLHVVVEGKIDKCTSSIKRVSVKKDCLDD